jgi:preprotein translocase subunit SecB
MTVTDDPGERPQLAAAARLDSILLRNLEWTMPEIQVPAGLPIQANGTVELAMGFSEGQTLYRISMTVPGIVEIEEEPTEIFRLNMTFVATYTIPPEFEFTKDELERYGGTSALPMVYPYFRELLHNTASRAGYHGLLLAPIIYFPQSLPAKSDTPDVE